VYNEHVISENAKTVAERVEKEVREKDDPLSAVLIGVDEPWDVCLVKLFWEVIRRSAAKNVRDMEKQRLFDRVEGLPRGIRESIEELFLRAAKDRSLIKGLATRLQEYGVFEEYEDRFFSLVKSSKGS